MIDDLMQERIDLENQTEINPLEYALAWEALARKFEAEGRKGAASNCMARAEHYAGLHAQTQKAELN